MSDMKTAFYFPRSYQDSRERFLKTPLPGAQRGQWFVPGKTDTDLFVDHAHWPALETPRFLLVLLSGIHGTETYAGSAVLQMFVEEILPRVDRRQVGIFAVHAMNPYGFKHHQRTTEAGVNLNRNFSVSGELFRRENADSARMHERFYARRPVASTTSALFETLKRRDDGPFFDDVSLDRFIKAIAPGQFQRPESLEFGGRALEPQTELLIAKMREIMPAYKDVLALDLHTGLGDRNRLHLLTSGDGRDLHPGMFGELFDAAADHEHYVYTPASEEGFYEVHGGSNDLFADLALPSQRVCAITMEFGTLGHSLEAQLDGLNSFIIGHQGQYYGFAEAAVETWSRDENFVRSYPQDDVWREAVVGASRGLFERVLKRAGAFR